MQLLRVLKLCFEILYAFILCHFEQIIRRMQCILFINSHPITTGVNKEFICFFPPIMCTSYKYPNIDSLQQLQVIFMSFKEEKKPYSLLSFKKCLLNEKYKMIQMMMDFPISFLTRQLTILADPIKDLLISQTCIM